MSEDWVVDGLIGFLHSPIWRSPINNFIDEHCVVFDQGDENKFAYTEVHNNFNSLVEDVLSSFTDELGISAEQLIQACLQSSQLEESYKKPLELILATDNFLLFKSIMVQRNIQLEQQAINLLRTQLGHAPQAYDPNSPQLSVPERESEEELLQQALEESKKDFDAQKSLDEEEMKKLMELAAKESLRLFEASEKEKKVTMESVKIQPAKTEPTATASEKSLSEGGSVEARMEKKQETVPKVPDTQPTMHKEARVSDSTEKSGESKLVSLSPGKQSAAATGGSTSEAASLWLQSAKQEFGHTEQSPGPSKQERVAMQVPDDLKRRELYLKRQRDHLLRAKREARAKELDSYKQNK